MSETFQKVQDALAIMSSSGTDKASALSFLEAFQKTPEAWQVVHAVLSQPEYPLEMKMFAAQTLRNKVTYDLQQLPDESLAKLKDSTIQFLVQYSEGSKPIRTQLSIALAKLSIQYLSWHNALEETITKLSQNIPALLEYLKILPEESLDPKGTPLTDEEFRIRTNELIVNNVEKVLMLLSNYAQNSSSPQANSLILDCLNSWIREIPVEQLLTIQPVTDVIFRSLKDEDSFEKAVECLCSIVKETRDIDNAQLIQALFEQIVHLRPLLQQHNDDPDVFGSLTRLFVECGEAWHMLIAKNPDYFEPLVEILLHCSAYEEDLDVVKYTFYFWYIFHQALITDRFKPAREKFKPLYTQLIHIMIHHLQYPDGGENDSLFPNKEEEEKFKDFRYEMGDVLKDCTAVIGSTQALTIPFDQIKTALSSNNIKWQDVEAPLFSMRAMAKEVSLRENQVLPQIMDLLVQLPENTKIRYAATLVLGRYTEWTAKHPEYLEKQLNYIINGFQAADQDIITAASHALMYFCQDCSKLLTNYIEQLYNFYVNIFQNLLSADLVSLYEITEGIAHVINTQEYSNISNATTMFIKPVLEKITGYVNAPGSEDVYKSIADEIEVIRIYFENIKPRNLQASEDPIGNLIIEIWPVVVQLINHHGHSMKVSERCMKFTKTILQNYNIFLTKILPSIAETIVKGFQTTKYGCYLWVSGVLIREFGDDYVSPEIKESIWKFAYQQIVTFLQVFKETNPVDIPDLIEDYSSMMTDIMMFFVTQFVLSDILKPAFDTALLALNIEKVEPLVTTLHFLVDLVSWGFDVPPISIYEDIPDDVRVTVKNFVAQNGGELTRVVLHGLIFTFPHDVHSEASDLLGKTIRLAPSAEVSVLWLNSALNSLPENSVSGQERSKLVTTVGTALNSKDYRRIRVSLKDFVTWYTRKNITPRFHSGRY